MAKLGNVKVAVVVTDGFEEVELVKPMEALKKEGAHVDIVSPNPDKVKAWAFTDWSKEYDVDKKITDVKPEDYDALLLPGGVMNPDKLRMKSEVVGFIKHFLVQNKPIASICHGPWTLIETGELADRSLTSFPSIKTDLINAGAKWQDSKVVVDDKLVTSRKPDDIPAFNEKMIDIFAKK